MNVLCFTLYNDVGDSYGGEGYIMNVLSRSERKDLLIKALEEYIKLLIAELQDAIIPAVAHGWRSKSYAKGIYCREKIETLKDEINKEE